MHRRLLGLAPAGAVKLLEALGAAVLHTPARGGPRHRLKREPGATPVKAEEHDDADDSDGGSVVERADIGGMIPITAALALRGWIWWGPGSARWYGTPHASTRRQLAQRRAKYSSMAPRSSTRYSTFSISSTVS